MKIKNVAKEHNQHIEDLRAAIEHRATWMYLLLDEARKQGLDWNNFARKAIFRCGHFHGKTKFAGIENILQFGERFASETLCKTFDIQVVELDENRFVFEIGYCPLVSAWLKQTDDENDIALLCDIAMDGDRGIVSTFPDFNFDLQSTIAKGDNVCRVVISKE